MTSPCLTPRCSGFAEIRGRCRGCASEANSTRAQTRGPRLYDRKRWKLTRRKVLFLTPLCEHDDGCDQIATDVHHLQTPEERPDLAYTLTNLQALCHSHHSQITRAEQTTGVREGNQNPAFRSSNRRVTALPQLSETTFSGSGGG